MTKIIVTDDGDTNFSVVPKIPNSGFENIVSYGNGVIYFNAGIKLFSKSNLAKSPIYGTNSKYILSEIELFPSLVVFKPNTAAIISVHDGIGLFADPLNQILSIKSNVGKPITFIFDNDSGYKLYYASALGSNRTPIIQAKMIDP